MGAGVTWGAEATAQGRPIVWGVKLDDSIICGRRADDSIIWGTRASDSIIWGMGTAIQILWPADQPVDNRRRDSSRGR